MQCRIGWLPTLIVKFSLFNDGSHKPAINLKHHSFLTLSLDSVECSSSQPGWFRCGTSWTERWKGPIICLNLWRREKCFALCRGSGLASERTFRTPLDAPTAVSSWCEMHRNVCYRLDVSVSVAFSVSDRPSVRNHCLEYINCCLLEFRLIYSKIRCDVIPFGNRNHSFAENFWTVLLFFFCSPYLSVLKMETARLLF